MNSKRAEQLFQFLKQNPDDSFVKFALALEHLNEGETTQTLKYFTEILEHDPDYTGVYYHLGKLYERINQPQLAEQTFREGIKRTMGKDQHANRELQEALNQLTSEDEEEEEE